MYVCIYSFVRHLNEQLVILLRVEIRRKKWMLLPCRAAKVVRNWYSGSQVYLAKRKMLKVITLASVWFDKTRHQTLFCIIPELVAKCGSDDDLTTISPHSCEDMQVKMADSTTLIDSNCCKKNQVYERQKLLPSKSNMKLLLSKGSVFVLGAMLVVAASVASQYHPPDNIINGNFSECTTSNTTAELFSSYTHSAIISPTSTFSVSTNGHITTSYSHAYFFVPLTPTP